MDDVNILKLDTIKLTSKSSSNSGTGKKSSSNGSTNAIKALRQKLRKFFDEADGHGSLKRQPPPTMITPQYFKIPNTVSCYPIKRLDWMAFVNATNYKKKITKGIDDDVQVQRAQAILGSPKKQ